MDLVRDELVADLDFSSLHLSSENQRLVKEIKNNPNSVAVHVRRGDFVNLGLCILTAEYYFSAIREMRHRVAPENPHLYFFSNGIDWVKNHLLQQLPEDITYSLVEGNGNDAGHVDLYLISLCSHQISSNSSFGFWGGFLNKNEDKSVIIPDKWVPNACENTLDSDKAHSFPGWLTINVNGD